MQCAILDWILKQNPGTEKEHNEKIGKVWIIFVLTLGMMGDNNTGILY